MFEDMAPIACSASLSTSAGITFQPSATAIAPHQRPVTHQATLLSSYDALASSRLSASSTTGRSPVTSVRTGYKSTTPVCQAFVMPKKDKELVKGELLLEIARVDRGAEASAEDRQRIDKIVQELETLNPTKEPLNSPLINGKWMLLYTTSGSTLQKNRQKFLRPNGPIYQAINTDTLRAQNLETWPFFNQVTANLTPVSPTKVVVNFVYFKIAGLRAGRGNGCICFCIRNQDSSDIDAVKGLAGEKELESRDLKSGFFTSVGDQTWCALCGSRSGWIECGKCMGKGAFATRPGLAGLKAKVGWACCKACYGKTVVPCILCGVDGVEEWERWQQFMRQGSIRKDS